jgi:hypothetical protein
MRIGSRLTSKRSTAREKYRGGAGLIKRKGPHFRIILKLVERAFRVGVIHFRVGAWQNRGKEGLCARYSRRLTLGHAEADYPA